MNDQQIKDYLEEIKKPLTLDGGDIEFISLKDNVLTLKVKGNCRGCPYFHVTFNQGLEQQIKQKFTQIKQIKYQ